ncbi:hypothetical protein C3F09_00250 [candidate division GN15 bacterium]|uniref:GAF domain-containing protein n=1 Tax=candidate division GN15 bacterium TaxID=2072418 RepID=A0A855X8C7_9BACT|nr:MAG: hypothetical protein C3F09_00250 [candidate division GN15 bacterium]
MYLQLAEWTIPLIFLLALVLLLKFRPALTAISRESYRCVSAGVATLAIVSVARVYYLNGLFTYIPFLSEPLFYRVVSWIGIITGTILVANGLSAWLPIVRLWKQNARTEARYSGFVQKIERLTGVESRADRLISLTLTVMFEHFRLRRGVALRFSRRENKFDLTGCVPETLCTQESFAQTTLNYQIWRSVCSGTADTTGRALEGLPATLQQADFIVPLTLGDQPLGCFLLWSDDDEPLSEEDVKHLRFAADAIARKVDADRLHMRADYYHRLALLNEKIHESVSSDRSLLKNLGTVLSAVSRTLNIDFVSLQIVGSGPRPVTCLSIGSNGALLTEKGLAAPPEGSPIHRALITGQPVIQQEPERNGSDPNDLMLAMPALAAVPIPTATKKSFVFVLSSRSRGAVGRQTARMLQSLGPVVTRLVELSESSRVAGNADRTLATLCNLHFNARRNPDFEAACSRAAAFLRGTLPADVVRISLVEPDSPFLRSLAFTGWDRARSTSPNDTLLIRSLMPLHDLAVRTGQIVLSPSHDFTVEPTAVEMERCLGGSMNALAILPVMNDGRTEAVITVGRTTRTTAGNFTRSEVLLARATADALSTVLVTGSRKPAPSFGRFRFGSFDSPFAAMELRSRMKSSLSGIMGSVELMKAQNEPDTPSMNRYLSIIDKSAQRMHQYLEQAEPSRVGSEG